MGAFALQPQNRVVTKGNVEQQSPKYLLLGPFQKMFANPGL